MCVWGEGGSEGGLSLSLSIYLSASLSLQFKQITTCSQVPPVEVIKAKEAQWELRHAAELEEKTLIPASLNSAAGSRH